MSAKNILTVENIAFERNDNLLFHPVDLALSRGEALHIEGSNGSGKTTLFRLLTGVLQPSCGSVYFRGKPIEQCRYDYLSELLFIGHQSAVKGMLSAQENLKWMSPPATSAEELACALSSVGLEGYTHIPCHNLSAGQHRRVALARLITSKASLWYLDEPFAALDKQGIALIESCMQAHIEQGGAILFSSHQDLAKTAVRKYSIVGYQEAF